MVAPDEALSSREVRKRVGRMLRGGPAVLPIVQAGHPALRAVATPYDGQLSEDLLAELVEAMRLTMHDAPGVGLAAPQIGLPLALAVAADDGEEDDPRERTPLPFRLMANPRYEAVGTETESFYEGCLSVEGYQAVVARARTVRARFEDAAGRTVVQEHTGWPARILAHETDHLNGRLYVDIADMRTLASNDALAERDDEQG